MTLHFQQEVIGTLCYLGVPHHRSHELNFNISATQASLTFHDKLIQVLLLSLNYSSPDTCTETHGPQSCAIWILKTLCRLALFSLCSDHALPGWSSLLDNPSSPFLPTPHPQNASSHLYGFVHQPQASSQRLLHAHLLLRLRGRSSIYSLLQRWISNHPKQSLTNTTSTLIILSRTFNCHRCI